MCSLQEVGAKGRLVWVLVLTLCCNEQGMLLGILLQLFCFLFLSPGIMLSEQFARWGYYYYFFSLFEMCPAPCFSWLATLGRKGLWKGSQTAAFCYVSWM